MKPWPAAATPLPKTAIAARSSLTPTARQQPAASAGPGPARRFHSSQAPSQSARALWRRTARPSGPLPDDRSTRTKGAIGLGDPPRLLASVKGLFSCPERRLEPALFADSCEREHISGLTPSVKASQVPRGVRVAASRRSSYQCGLLRRVGACRDKRSVGCERQLHLEHA